MEYGDLTYSKQIPKTLSEQLTENFYRWEKRGRGWQVYDCPVELEPPYEPFYHFYIPPLAYDDGRTPGLMDKIKAWFSSSQAGSAQHAYVDSDIIEEAFSEPFPELCDDDSALVYLRLTLPKEKNITIEEGEQFLLALGRCVQPLSYEIIGSPDEIALQFACREPDFPYLHQQVQAYFPEVSASISDDLLKSSWRSFNVKFEKVIIDFGLSQEFMLPLRTYRNFNVDPLSAVIGALSDLKKGETAVFQLLFQAALNPWPDSIIRAVLDWEGKAFFSDAPQIVSLTKEKISRPLFAVILRIAVQSESEERTWKIAKALSSAISLFSNPLSNELIPLENDNRLDEGHEAVLLLRQSLRCGMLLNSEELTSLAHLPSASVQVKKLKREIKKTKAAPQIVSGHRLVLGENVHAGKISTVSLNADQRIKHAHIIGASGTGKSTLLLRMILQDIESGQGLAVLDPHGDLIDQILSQIPVARFEDVIVFDPSDAEFPIGFNILQSHSELEKTLLSSDLVALFQRLSTSWGDQMTSVLGNAVLAFLESRQGGTLFDLRRFLIENGFRNEFLKTVADPHIIYYWKKEFPLLKYKPQASILTRLDSFLRPKLIRNIVCQKENRLDFKEIMDSGKIFLAKLAQGAIGEENSYLLGTLLVSTIHKVTLARQEIDQAQRKLFFLYIDEFQNFVTPSMAAVLSGARKYHLGLILAHQELQQLFDKDRNVASAVMSNPYTRICFRLGESDANRLKDGFSFYDSRDLQNLGIGDAICRVERADYDFNLKTFPLPEVAVEEAKERQERLINFSREKYGIQKIAAETALPKEAVIKPKEEKRPKKVVSLESIAKAEQEVLDKLSQPSYAKIKEIGKEIRTQKDKLLGRGGPRHKYVQQLVKRFSEEKGYRAIIEKELSGGFRVDVDLEKDDKRIACQIAITTTEKHEIENIRNCFKDGYDQVFIISMDKRILKKIEKLAKKEIESENLKKLSFFNLEEIFALFDQEAPKEDMVAGYKVKVRYQPLAEHEERERRQTISKVILESLKKLKGD